MWFANVYATCGNGLTDLTVVVDDYISLFIHLSMQIGACWAILFQKLGMGGNVPVAVRKLCYSSAIRLCVWMSDCHRPFQGDKGKMAVPMLSSPILGVRSSHGLVHRWSPCKQLRKS